MGTEEIHSIHELFEFLDRMNTSMFEVEVVSDTSDGTLREFGTILETKTKLILHTFQSIVLLFHTIQNDRASRYITNISFTNVILSGTIDFLTKKVDIIFHTIEDIQNILHQLVDIPIPRFELNIKLIHTGQRRRAVQT